MRLPCSFSSAVDNCFVAIPDLVNNGMYEGSFWWHAHACTCFLITAIVLPFFTQLYYRLVQCQPIKIRTRYICIPTSFDDHCYKYVNNQYSFQQTYRGCCNVSITGYRGTNINCAYTVRGYQYRHKANWLATFMIWRWIFLNSRSSTNLYLVEDHPSRSAREEDGLVFIYVNTRPAAAKGACVLIERGAYLNTPPPSI